MTGDVYLQMLQNWLRDELSANNMKFLFINRTVLHLTGSSLCELISMTICQEDGSGVLVVKTM